MLIEYKGRENVLNEINPLKEKLERLELLDKTLLNLKEDEIIGKSKKGTLYYNFLIGKFSEIYYSEEENCGRIILKDIVALSKKKSSFLEEKSKEKGQNKKCLIYWNIKEQEILDEYIHLFPHIYIDANKIIREVNLDKELKKYNFSLEKYFELVNSKNF